VLLSWNKSGVVVCHKSCVVLCHILIFVEGIDGHTFMLKPTFSSHSCLPVTGRQVLQKELEIGI